ncbi:hypothetical protein FHG87_014080 [Trinorchestia longiramus]|nr:hypothetical protein FHG87_014080 [Trinorchestia longiramus]
MTPILIMQLPDAPSKQLCSHDVVTSKQHRRNNNRDFTVMAVKHMRWELLEDVQYEAMDGISRCLHLGDFDRCWKKKALIPHKLSSNVVYTDNVGKILWFSPSVAPDDHNKYGNVAFNISMQKLLCEFQFAFYYIDRLQFSTHACTRLLFSEKEYDQFDIVEFTDHGSSLKRNRWRYAATDAGFPHQVEIAIETEVDGREWLFSNCDYNAVDHSLANSRKRTGGFKPNICHRFNMFGRRCPFAYSVETTQWELDRLYYTSDSEEYESD